MATLLIAEDDKHIRMLMERQLSLQHIVLCAADGQEAWDIISEREIDLLIADIMMPGMDGFGLIKKTRETGTSIPILIITANQSFDYKRQGFSLGTDDYLTKPFDMEELSWRVQALLKRADIVDESQLKRGSLKMDQRALTLMRGDSSVILPQKEFELLHKFMLYPGRIYTRNQLLDSIWGYTVGSEDTVKTHISRLRQSLHEFPELKIKAVKGIGYKLEWEDEEK